MRAPSTMWPLRRAVGRLVAHFACLLVSLVLIAGLSRPAGRYFYCEAMGMLPFDPCAAAGHEPAERAGTSDATIAIAHHDCCEVFDVQAAPRGATVERPAIAPPALVALVPPFLVSDAWLSGTRRARGAPFERWRAPPRPPGRARAALMVFST